MTASSQGGVGAAGQCPQEHGPDAPATPRDRWLRAAVILWVVFGIAVGIKAFVPPGAEQHSVYPTFSEAARRWYADEPLYGDHGFYNSPALAAALAPLALLRDAYGGVLWGALNLGLLFAALRAFFRQVLAPLRPGLCEGQSRMSSSSPARDRPSSAFCDRWIWGLLLLGVAVRSVRYLLRFPLCADETLLAVNFLDRGYLDLLRPLDYAQVAPLLFLWAELTVIKLLGFSEYSLRLLPFVCSLASLLLFRRLVRLLLRGSAAVLAVAIFAVSYSCIRYSAEAKPYGSDVLVSLVLLTLAVRWWRTPGENRWLWLLTALAPLAVGLSYPAVFVAGGVSLAVAAVLWSSSVRRGWRPWLAYNAALAASFGGLYLLCTRGQAQAELELMVGLWQSAFPPLDSIGRFLAWLAAAHTGSLVAQPIGGEHYGSTLTFLLCAVGMAALVRRGRYRLLLLCAAPPALNFLAALLRRYPYGGHVRLAMYLAPIVCLLAGLGAAVVLEAFRRRPQVRRGSPDPAAARPQVSEGGETFGRRCGSVGDRPQHGGGSVGDRPQHGDRPLRGESTGETPVPPRRAFEDVRALVPASPRPRVSASRTSDGPRALVPASPRPRVSASRTSASRTSDGPRAPGAPVLILLAALVMLGVGSIVRDFRLPAKHRRDLVNRELAAWFWGTLGQQRELVCLATELKRTFPCPTGTWNDPAWTTYLCNQRIYSPRHARQEPPRLDRVCAGRPLACVQFFSHLLPYDQAALAAWLKAMQLHYELVASYRYTLLSADDPRAKEPPDALEVYEFVPR